MTFLVNLAANSVQLREQTIKGAHGTGNTEKKSCCQRLPAKGLPSTDGKEIRITETAEAWAIIFSGRRILSMNGSSGSQLHLSNSH